MKLIRILLYAALVLVSIAPKAFAFSAYSPGTGSTGSGTVNSGTSGQLAYYAGSGTAVSGTTIGGDCTFSAPSTFTCNKGFTISTFAGLPVSPSGNPQYIITDAASCITNTAVVAGSNAGLNCPTYYNGTNWIALGSAQIASVAALATTPSTSCNGATVTLGVQTEFDCTMSANSTVSLAIPSSPNTIPTNGIMSIQLRTCQDASVGAHSLTVNAPGGWSIAWTQDGGTMPQPSQATSTCTLYQLTAHANLSQLIEQAPAMLATVVPKAAVETCASTKFLNQTSTNGGGTADCNQPAFTDLSGAATTGQLPSNPAISPTNSVSGKAGSAQNVLFEDAPVWMHFLGTGAEADPGPNSFSAQGVHFYTNLTINSGQTITVTDTLSTVGSPTDKPNAGFIAYVQGTCTIAGTIAANGIFAESSNFGGGSSGGGGFGAANGVVGNASSLPGNGGAVAIATAGAAGTSGVAGTAGSTPDASAINDALSGAPAWGNCGGARGGAGGSAGGGLGGLGGGCVMLICNTINFTGTINVAGAQGGAGGSSTGPGGGGGGGIILLAAHSLTDSGTKTVTAGLAGTAGTGTATAAGAGGAGWTKNYTLN